jgi:hypothetical protein
MLSSKRRASFPRKTGVGFMGEAILCAPVWLAFAGFYCILMNFNGYDVTP